MRRFLHYTKKVIGFILMMTFTFLLFAFPLLAPVELGCDVWDLMLMTAQTQGAVNQIEIQKGTKAHLMRRLITNSM
jgi:hypothetical protein